MAMFKEVNGCPHLRLLKNVNISQSEFQNSPFFLLELLSAASC